MIPSLYVGTVTHQRALPKKHRFRYPLFMWFFNLAELDTLPRLGHWFSPAAKRQDHRPALYRFHRADYYGSTTQPLAEAIKERMAELTGEPISGEVYGLINVRALGLYFSPVNFYYGYDRQGDLSHFLAEVSNTPWNERHQYCHLVTNGNLAPKHQKTFYVSPFNPVDQRYRWQLTPPGPTVSVQIEVNDRRGHIFVAKLALKRMPLDLPTVRWQILKKPVMPAAVIVGIYWQALKLYLKGVPYIPYRQERDEKI